VKATLYAVMEPVATGGERRRDEAQLADAEPSPGCHEGEGSGAPRHRSRRGDVRIRPDQRRIWTTRRSIEPTTADPPRRLDERREEERRGDARL
jgi:hypothetical protein